MEGYGRSEAQGDTGGGHREAREDARAAAIGLCSSSILGSPGSLGRWPLGRGVGGRLGRTGMAQQRPGMLGRGTAAAS